MSTQNKARIRIVDSPEDAGPGKGEGNTGRIVLQSPGDPRPQQGDAVSVFAAQTSLPVATPGSYVNKQSAAGKSRLAPVRKHSLLTFNKKKGEIQISKAARSKSFRSRLHSTGMIGRRITHLVSKFTVQ
jgi:hypothetical protein